MGHLSCLRRERDSWGGLLELSALRGKGVPGGACCWSISGEAGWGGTAWWMKAATASREERPAPGQVKRQWGETFRFQKARHAGLQLPAPPEAAEQRGNGDKQSAGQISLRAVSSLEARLLRVKPSSPTSWLCCPLCASVSPSLKWK